MMIRPLLLSALLTTGLAGCDIPGVLIGDDPLVPGANDQPATPSPAKPPANESAPIEPPGEKPYEPPTCARKTIAIDQPGKPSQVVLVVDRSGSMARTIATVGDVAVSKWAAMRYAVNALLKARSNEIAFGLAVYPRTTGCTAGSISVAPARNNTTQIDAALAANPNGAARTPTAQTLRAIAKQLAAVPSTTPRYVILATDGKPWCDSAGERAQETDAKVVAAVTALRAAGVRTLVIGFGSDVINARPKLLNDLAIAGGMPRTGAKHAFYAATDPTALTKAVFDIAGRIGSPTCSFKIKPPAGSVGAPKVKLDGQPVPANGPDGDGWRYKRDAATITFEGPSCRKLRDGSVKRIELEFLCPNEIG